MELKSGTFSRTAPLNSFKSHLYGIEITIISIPYSQNPGLNRTFMELKFYLRIRQITVLVQSLNRTFMELKLATTDSHGNAISV